MKIYLDFNEEIQKKIEESGISISQVLIDDGHDIKIQYESSPFKKEEGAISKDLILVLTAISIAIPPIITSIAKLLDVIYHKPHIFVCEELIELRDKDGNVIFDENNKVIYKINKVPKIIAQDLKDPKFPFNFSYSKLDGIKINIGPEEII